MAIARKDEQETHDFVAGIVHAMLGALGNENRIAGADPMIFSADLYAPRP